MKEVLRRRSESGQQHLHLFLLGPRRKKRRTREDLEDKTAQTPDIYLVIIGLHEDYLRRAVVTTLNVGKLLLVEEAS